MHLREEGREGLEKGLDVPKKLKVVQSEEEGADQKVLTPGKDREAAMTMKTNGDERMKEEGEEEERGGGEEEERRRQWQR